MSRFRALVTSMAAALASAATGQPAFFCGEPVGDVRTLVELDPGDGPALYAGGDILEAGGLPARGIARWNEGVWAPMSAGIEEYNNHRPTCFALTVFDDGTGPALYAAGTFGIEGAGLSANVARWDGQRWQPAGPGADDTVRALAAFDDGTGPALYAGGFFEHAGGIAADGVARWDGSTWSPVGEGLSGGAALFDGVITLAVADLGDGPGLYAGGNFTNSGQTPLGSVARWDGAQWTPLGAGVSEGEAFGGHTYVITMMPAVEAGNPVLYAGGSFTRAGDQRVSNIARWNGQAWSALTGTEVLDIKWVASLAMYDAGDDRALHIGSNFGSTAYVWRWTGQDVDLVLAAGYRLSALRSSDILGDGRLLAGGNGFVMNGKKLPCIIAWDGAAWLPMPCACPADCDLSGTLDLFDFLCFVNLFNAGNPAADCDASGALDLFDFLCFINAFNSGC